MSKALKALQEPLVRNNRHLTYVIYWKPRNSPVANGHAALIIDGDAWLNAPVQNQDGPLAAYFYDTFNYVSWVGGKIDWHPPKDSKKGGRKGVGSTFFNDMCNWGGEAYGEGMLAQMKWPTRWVALEGLNTQAMQDAWNAAKNKQGGHWRLLDKNCATMVHTILKAGGGDGFATGHKKQLVWWPSDLIRYAKSMEGHVVARSNDPEAPFM